MTPLPRLVTRLQKELKDVWQHSLRVARCAKIIGINLGLGAHELKTVWFGGLVHDAGKMYMWMEAGLLGIQFFNQPVFRTECRHKSGRYFAVRFRSLTGVEYAERKCHGSARPRGGLPRMDRSLRRRSPDPVRGAACRGGGRVQEKTEAAAARASTGRLAEDHGQGANDNHR